MKIIRIKDAKAYHPPRHNNMVALKLSDQELTGAQKFWCGLSHFLPGGGAEWAYDDSPTEKIYVVLDGEITIKVKQETQTLYKGDVVFLAPFEGREVINNSNYPSSILVIVSNN